MPTTTNDDKFSLKKVKDVIMLTLAVVSCIAGFIFWVQSSVDSKTEAVRSETKAELKLMQKDIDKLEENTSKILVTLGRMEGYLHSRGKK